MALEHRSSAGETPCPIGANKKSSLVTKQPHRPDGPIQKTLGVAIRKAPEMLHSLAFV
jgi:hypothetical protein